ncbi:MAG: FAD-binding oxidoreductase [Roseivivax sp.]|nr:FAD-binding oxidoreductase [Roseivivax sp.]
MIRVVVIGGGIAGISAAARLAPEARVTLLEAETALGYHASGRSAAAFLGCYGNAAVRALNDASEPELLSLPGVMSRRGMMLLGSPGQEAAFAANVDALGLERIDIDRARAIVPVLNPERATLIAVRPDVYDVDTDLLMQGFRQTALRHGAEFVTGARVDRIERHAQTWTVHAGGRAWQADVIVNAAGAWADGVARLAGIRPLGIVPHRRSMARVALPEGIDATRWPFLDGVDDGWYAKPDAGALIVSPADEDPVEPHDAWAEDMTLAEGIARYEEMVTAPVTRMLSNWAGLRSFAPDRTLVIGPDPAEPGFVWLAGQGGYGFQTCCAASRLAAALVVGQAPALAPETVAALSPARFG